MPSIYKFYLTRLNSRAIAPAGLFPGAMYLLSSFYKRKEYGLRAAIFFSAATISGGESSGESPPLPFF